MEKNLLEQLRAWQKEGQGTRKAEITIGYSGEIQIWVYDTSLLVGQFVKSADEINLEETKLKNDKAAYERLKKQFEGVSA